MDIDELKKYQLRIIKKYKRCNWILRIILLIILYHSAKMWKAKNIEFDMIIAILILEICWFKLFGVFIKVMVNSKGFDIFIENLKKLFLLDTLKKFFSNVVYDPEKGFDKSFIEEIGILNTADKYSSNDFVSGTYKNINFEQADIEIKEKFKGEFSYSSIFNGKLMIFDLKKRFKTDISIISDGFKVAEFPHNKSFLKVLIDDEEFNEKFSVYAENEHYAPYIVTPNFIEKLKMVNEKIECEMMFTFLDNKLYIAIDNWNDIFEWDVFEIIDEQKIEENIINDIKVIIDFVSNLNLDNNFFINEEENDQITKMQYEDFIGNKLNNKEK